MPFTTRLELKAECDNCPKYETEIHWGDAFGIQEEEDQLITDFLFDLHFNRDWLADKISYEEWEILCPLCKKAKQNAA